MHKLSNFCSSLMDLYIAALQLTNTLTIRNYSNELERVKKYNCNTKVKNKCIKCDNQISYDLNGFLKRKQIIKELGGGSFNHQLIHDNNSFILTSTSKSVQIGHLLAEITERFGSGFCQVTQ